MKFVYRCPRLCIMIVFGTYLSICHASVNAGTYLCDGETGPSGDVNIQVCVEEELC